MVWKNASSLFVRTFFYRLYIHIDVGALVKEEGLQMGLNEWRVDSTPNLP